VVASDALGNAVLAGGVEGTLDLGGGPLEGTAGASNVYLGKLSGMGEYDWAKIFGDT
jgi:hypothetical protein